MSDTDSLAGKADSSEPSSGGNSRGQSPPRIQPDRGGETRRPPRPRREEEIVLPEVAYVDDDLFLDDDDAPSDTTATESESKEATGRPRRRRGRRGRGGVGRDREEKPATGRSVSKDDDLSAFDDDDDDAPFAAELEPKSIDDQLSDDGREGDDSAEAIRRGRQRGRGRGGESRGRSEQATPQDSDAAEISSASAAPRKHGNVPTWLDTINILVDANIERHRRSGPSRAPQGRGGRR